MLCYAMLWPGEGGDCNDRPRAAEGPGAPPEPNHAVRRIAASLHRACNDCCSQALADTVDTAIVGAGVSAFVNAAQLAVTGRRLSVTDRRRLTTEQKYYCFVVQSSGLVTTSKEAQVCVPESHVWSAPQTVTRR